MVSRYSHGYSEILNNVYRKNAGGGSYVYTAAVVMLYRGWGEQ